MQGVRPVVEVVRLGLVTYQEALRLQQVYVNRHKSGPAHTLLLCQHPPVYTTGIRHKPYAAPLLDGLRLLGADVHQTNRGGLITFHGPGQLVCYPVLNLGSFKKSVRWYVCELEKTIMSVCSSFGIEASTSPHTGVWVGDNKICAIGTTPQLYCWRLQQQKHMHRLTASLVLTCHITRINVISQFSSLLSKEKRRKILPRSVCKNYFLMCSVRFYNAAAEFTLK
ncbi:putative lipoyltransferase 2, mitochondrial isoform X2 [Xiphias gladius]|uniref:putative lipoyltransferase 2, mitochondrial isoform X2 n=1 Tax=Xiphias gladius TaxID=8245 RepID=UPI001A98BD07|nr:putative lipoyltransferase 2, mitochondrial isoform X2 [Xiphias gladius]